MGSDNRTNSSVSRQPKKDLPRHPTAADRHSNIGAELQLLAMMFEPEACIERVRLNNLIISDLKHWSSTLEV